ncbi:MAG: N-acetyltransferase [Acidobacteria bacterium ACB1]|nr:N-acetyltransferase [Acidobacteria bacterium ACB1]RIJ89590.1 MAG: hypothetical protein DCC44_11765 [Acidobacteriota bacterium]
MADRTARTVNAGVPLMTTILETPRLLMRPFTMEDLPWLVEMRTAESVAKYMGGSRWQNPEALRKRMQFYIECWDKFDFAVCGMMLKETGEMIGTSGIQPLEDTGEIEVGYSIIEKYWGMGIGFECAFAWLDHGFEHHGLERIVAVAHPDNKASRRIMEKCGMEFERTEEHYGQETVFYAVSRERFRELKRQLGTHS